MAKVDIQKKADQIIQRYFVPIITEIIPKIDSDKKLYALINTEANFLEDEVKLISLCFPRQNQICSAFALSKLVDNLKNDYIINKYLNFAKTNYIGKNDELMDNLLMATKTI